MASLRFGRRPTGEAGPLFDPCKGASSAVETRAAASTEGSGTPTRGTPSPFCCQHFCCHPFSLLLPTSSGLCLSNACLWPGLTFSLPLGCGDCQHLQMRSLPFETLRDSLHWHKSKVRELIHLARQKNPTVIMSHIGVYSFNSFILFLLRKEFFQGTHSILYISHFIFHRGKKRPFHT